MLSNLFKVTKLLSILLVQNRMIIQSMVFYWCNLIYIFDHYIFKSMSYNGFSCKSDCILFWCMYNQKTYKIKFI